MPKSKLNEHIRWLVVERTLEGLSTRRIAAQLSISKSSVSKTFLNFKKYGCVEDLLPLGRGRSRILTVEDIKYLKGLLEEKIDWYLWELQSEMELWLGHHVSYSTIWRGVYRLGYTHKQVKQIFICGFIVTVNFYKYKFIANLFICLFFSYLS